MSERSGIEIDYCPSCRGVWLDRGELDKIIDRSSDVVQAKRSEDTDQSRRIPTEHYDSRDNQYKRRKKESFLSDLFDF